MSYDLAFFRFPIFADEDDANAQLGLLSAVRTESGRVDTSVLVREVFRSFVSTETKRLDPRASAAPSILVPFTRREILDGFAGSPLEVKEDRDTILGRGFSLDVRDGDRLAYVTCAWSLAEDPRRVTLLRIETVFLKLGAWSYDPQSERMVTPLRLREGWIEKVRREERERQPPPPRPWLAGEKVRHAKFGDGEIVKSDGDTATVRFEGGERTLVVRVLQRVE